MKPLYEIKYDIYNSLKPSSWAFVLKDFIISDYFDNIIEFLYNKSYIKSHFLPKVNNILDVFKVYEYDNLRVLIIPEFEYTSFMYRGIPFENYTKIINKGNMTLNGSFKTCYNYHISKTHANFNYLSKQGVMITYFPLTFPYENTVMHYDLWMPLFRFIIERLYNDKPNTIMVQMKMDNSKLECYLNQFKNYIKIHSIDECCVKRKNFYEEMLPQKVNRLLIENNMNKIDWMECD